MSTLVDRRLIEDIAAGLPSMDPRDKRIAELEAALHKINALIDSPSRFNADVQAVLDSVIDSVIDTSDVKF